MAMNNIHPSKCDGRSGLTSHLLLCKRNQQATTGHRIAAQERLAWPDMGDASRLVFSPGIGGQLAQLLIGWHTHYSAAFLCLFQCWRDILINQLIAAPLSVDHVKPP